MAGTRALLDEVGAAMPAPPFVAALSRRGWYNRLSHAVTELSGYIASCHGAGDGWRMV
jgi:hypothetical protein